MDQKPRRDFLKKAALALPIVAVTDSADANAADDATEGSAESTPETKNETCI